MATRSIKKEVIEEVAPVAVVEPVRRRSMAERMFPIMFVMMLIMAFGLGSLWTKATYLQNLPTTTAPAQAAAPAAPAAVSVSRDQIKNLFSQNVIKFGNADAKLSLVEIADPSCPYCHAAAGHNGELSKQMGAQFLLTSDGGTYVSPVQEMKKLVDAGKASFVWIYSNGHGHGELATTALYCAQDQGKFWQAHDKFMSADGYKFMNDNPLKYDPSSADTSQGFKKVTDADMKAYTNFLGQTVDTGSLLDCLTSRKYVSRLSSEQSLSQSLGVSGTPGFFINEKNFAGAYSWTEMKSDAEASL